MLERKDIIDAYERTGSMRAVARELNINRKTVKNYVRDYLIARNESEEAYIAYLKSEPAYKTPNREKPVLTEAVRGQIDSYLKENEEKRRRGDRKLCMKAKDMHRELSKLGINISYPSICKYIQSQKNGGTDVQECYIRQTYRPGEECQFDWGEMYLTIDGRRTKVYMAVFTLPYSNHRAAYLYLHQDTQAFLESHREYFRLIGHVPRRMVYDNMRVAVRSFVGGKHPTDALLRLESVYGYRHRFCNAHSGNEKAYVERSVEVVRRRAFCRIDTFPSLDAAQAELPGACADLAFDSDLGKSYRDTVEGMLEEECKYMIPVKEDIGCFEQQSYHVDKYGTIVIKGTHYSVPDHLVGKRLNVFLYSNEIRVYDGGKQVARHERTPQNGWKLDLMHYLRTFERKPGAVAGSTALHMADDKLRNIFVRHFSDTPADFVTLLKKTREKGLKIEDILKQYDIMLGYGMRPSLDSFSQLMFEKATPKEDGRTNEYATSQEIERQAQNSLQELAALINSNYSSTTSYAAT